MSYSQIKILIIDDEPDILEILRYNLSKENYQVFTAQQGEEGLELARKELPDLIILDIMLPETDGIELCRRLREKPEFSHTLIIFLTARGEAYSEIAGFEVGADDYITKPVKPRVLVSRIKALLRRKLPIKEEENIIQFGVLTIDKGRHIVLKNNVEIDMPKKEFEILLLLTSKPGKLFTRHDIYTSVWGNQLIVGERTLDVYIRKLREKLGEDYIRTVKGIGYKFEF